MSKKSKKYFRCDPGNLCEAADCCRDYHTYPSISVGDLIRISQYTNEPIDEIWRTKGTVSLAGQSTNFFVSTALLHDPCPYLTDQNRCSIQPVKPMGCGAFPLVTYVKDPASIKRNYSHLRCLQGVKPKPKQLKLWPELEKIMKQEAELDYQFMWKDNIRVSTPTLAYYFKLAVKALELQEERDPNEETQRTEQLKAVVLKMDELKDSDQLNGIVDPDFYRRMLRPVVFSLFQEEIARRLERIDEKVIKAYEETTETWRELVKRVK